MGRHHADRVGPIPEIGEELVEFGLDGALNSREQEAQDGWEGEGAITGEEMGFKAGDFQQFDGKQVLGKSVNDGGICRASCDYPL